MNAFLKKRKKEKKQKKKHSIPKTQMQYVPYQFFLTEKYGSILLT